MSWVDRLRGVFSKPRSSQELPPEVSVPGDFGIVRPGDPYTGDTIKLSGHPPSQLLDSYTGDTKKLGEHKQSLVEEERDCLVLDLPDSLIQLTLEWSEFAKRERSIYTVPVAEVVFTLPGWKPSVIQEHYVPFFGIEEIQPLALKAKLSLQINPFNGLMQGNPDANILQLVLRPYNDSFLLSRNLKDGLQDPKQIQVLLPLVPEIGIDHREPTMYFQLQEYFPIFCRPAEPSIALGIFNDGQDKGIFFFRSRDWRDYDRNNNNNNKEWRNLRNRNIERFNEYFPARIAYLLDRKDEGASILKVWREIVSDELQKGSFAAFSPLFPSQPEIFVEGLQKSAMILSDVTNRILTAIALLGNEMRSVCPATSWSTYTNFFRLPRNETYSSYKLPDFGFNWLDISNYAPEGDRITQKNNRANALALERFLPDES